MSHTVGHKLPTALSDVALLVLSGLRREVSLSLSESAKALQLKSAKL